MRAGGIGAAILTTACVHTPPPDDVELLPPPIVVVAAVVRSAHVPLVQAPVERAPLGEWSSDCSKVGELWEGLRGKLVFDEVKGKPVVKGSFEFIGRTATAELNGERMGRSPRWVYSGEMHEASGLGTSWGLRLEVQRKAERYLGELREIVEDEEEPNLMCRFSWPAG